MILNLTPLQSHKLVKKYLRIMSLVNTAYMSYTITSEL